MSEIALFGLLGALMYASKVLMEFLPNVHLLGVFIVAETVVFRKKALYIIYTFALITGLFNGFSTWWIPYLYIWTILWAFVMLLPNELSGKKAIFIYAAVCSLHGFLYGTLYAPFQAIAFGLSFKSTLAWIAAGLPWDCIHGVSNLVCGLLIVPLIRLMRTCVKHMP